MQIFEDRVKSWCCLIWIYVMVLSGTVTDFCLYILKVLSLLLSLLSLYFLHQVNLWLMWDAKRGLRGGVLSGGWGWSRLARLFSAAVCVQGDSQCPGKARLDWAHLQGLCFQSLCPFYVPALLTEEVLNFSFISLESLASVTSSRIQTTQFLSQAFRFTWKINTRMWENCLLDTV